MHEKSSLRDNPYSFKESARRFPQFVEAVK